MSGGLTAENLLDGAEGLLRSSDRSSAGYWARGSALLARMALEAVLTEALAAYDAGLVRASTRSKLLVLPLLADEALVRRAEVAWNGLSRACHQHPYELAPTRAELEALLDDVRTVVAGLVPAS